MKAKISIAFVTVMMLTGCGAWRNFTKDVHQNMTGLHKRITLYGATGVPIRSWETNTKTDDRGGTCFFITKDDRMVTISGTFVIEEIP